MSQAMASSRPKGSVFWPVVARFAWKELRATRGLALGAGAILVVLLGIIRLLYWSAGERVTHEESQAFWVIATVVSALYAVAASISVFSAERELKTHTLLFQLPHQWLAMGLGKLIAVVGSTLILAAVLGGMALAFADGLLPYRHACGEPGGVSGRGDRLESLDFASLSAATGGGGDRLHHAGHRAVFCHGLRGH
jgi:hypothetical protein